MTATDSFQVFGTNAVLIVTDAAALGTARAIFGWGGLRAAENTNGPSRSFFGGRWAIGVLVVGPRNRVGSTSADRLGCWWAVWAITMR
jgi:hypothetical protein